jgi:hypothetical protein
VDADPKAPVHSLLKPPQSLFEVFCNLAAHGAWTSASALSGEAPLSQPGAAVHSNHLGPRRAGNYSTGMAPEMPKTYPTPVS